MTIRMTRLLAAMALTFAASPAMAQDEAPGPGLPPPLPQLGDAAWDEEWDEYLQDAPLEAPPLPEERRAVPIERPRVTLGYTSAERGQWLAQCQERTRDLTICEDYLGRYEQAVYGSGRVQGPAGCASPAGPVTWVRVPIVREVPPQR